MTDKLKELINKDNFTMPQKTKDKLDETLNRIKMRRVRTRKIIPLAAALVIVLTISVFAINPSLARSIPGISYIFNQLTGYEGEYDKYSEDINQTVTGDGYTITLDNAVLDDKELALGFTIKSEEDIKNAIHFTEIYLFINGKPVDFYAGGNGKLVDKNTYISTSTIDLYNVKIPDKADFKFVIKKITNDMQKPVIDGNWSFNFTASKVAAREKSHEFKVNKKVLLGNTYVTLTKVSMTPLNTTIYYKGKMSDDMPRWQALIDDKGKQVLSKGSSGNAEGLNMQFDRFNETPDSITILPYNILGNTEWIAARLDKLPVTLEQGKIGQITIEKIDFLSDRTDVYYSVDGKLPLDQAYSLKLVDKNGNDIYRNNNIQFLPEQLDYSQKNFRTVFPACNKEDIKEIKTINFDKYYKFFDPVKIELK